LPRPPPSSRSGTTRVNIRPWRPSFELRSQRADVVEMLKAGLVSIDEIAAHLLLHTPFLVRRFDVLREEAARELEEG
jgi:hypothetical protein